MATETLSNPESMAAGLAEIRNQTLLRAAREAAAIAAMLQRDAQHLSDSGDIDLVLPGALMRIEALCTSVSILQDARWPDNISEEHRVVFGKPLEVTHG
ncbi:hypothetical protein [Roseateles sp.]|uniref:hypothetical protein n=1 Tax=Roseateles sp. TaxID=1971397 RepID=UPI00395095BA